MHIRIRIFIIIFISLINHIPETCMQVMEAVGASRELVKRGAKEGDTIWVAEGRAVEFEPPMP